MAPLTQKDKASQAARLVAVHEHVMGVARLIHPYRRERYRSQTDWWLHVLETYGVQKDETDFAGQHLTWEWILFLWHALLEKEAQKWNDLSIEYSNTSIEEGAYVQSDLV